MPEGKNVSAHPTQVCAAAPLVICGVLSFNRLVRTVSAPNFTLNWRNMRLKHLKYSKQFLKSRKYEEQKFLNGLPHPHVTSDESANHSGCLLISKTNENFNL